MSLEKVLQIAKEVNTKKEDSGYAVNWQTLPCLIDNSKGGSTSPYINYWLDPTNWIKLAENNGLIPDEHVGKLNQQTSTFWISIDLKELADHQNWEFSHGI